MTRNATTRPPRVGARTTRKVEGASEDPSSSICVHSIAMRKQTTARPDKMPISTARKRKNWSSRMVKMRCVQACRRARKPEKTLGFDGASGDAVAGPGDATPIGSFTGLELRGYALKATERDLRFAACRMRPPRHFPSGKRGALNPQRFRG